MDKTEWLRVGNRGRVKSGGNGRVNGEENGRVKSAEKVGSVKGGEKGEG